MKRIFLFFSLVGFLSNAFGFIPPVAALIKDTFEGRRSAPAVEVVFRHRVLGDSGETTELEERIYLAAGRVYTMVRGGGTEVGGSLVSGAYAFAEGKKYPHRSPSWLRYWVSANADDWREQLINERFVRREALKQFKDTFNPVGDPASWGSLENYNRLSDVFFSRSNRGLVTIAVQGSADPANGRTIFFDRTFLGPRRFEWREGGETYAWNLDQFRKLPAEGTFAGRAVFRVQEKDRVATELVSRRSLKDKQWSDIFKTWTRVSKVPVPPSLDESLRGLLSYR